MSKEINETINDTVNKPIAPKEVIVDTLSDRDHVRLRRGMYLPNINYCAYELLDNCVDEFVAGYGKNIWFQIEPDKTMRVQDDGRGVPVKPSLKDPTKSMAEMALGALKSGGKFEQQSEHAIKTGGLHGVGASAVNFTCDEFIATIVKDGEIYQIGWEKGLLKEPLSDIGKADANDIQNGTLIELKPDMSIWVDSDYDINAIMTRIKQLTYLNAGLIINVDVNYNNKKIEESICHPDGLVSYVNDLASKKETMMSPVCIRNHFDTKLGDVEIEIALSYNTSYSEEIYAFTNSIPNPLGGQHMTGFKDGLYRSIKDYYIENTKGKLIDLSSEDVREGLIAVVSVKVADPVFDGQGKAKLEMPALRAVVKEATMTMMEDFLDKNPEKAKLIISKALQAQKTREATRKAREATRSMKNAFSTPAKLTLCTTKNPEEAEVWFVEGDSAGGSCKKARFAKFQSILPVFGKINNTENMNIVKINESVKLKEVIGALGCGIGETFDIDKLRYHKIIIASDADDDGLHIQCLWINFFYRHMREIIENGYLYISCPPLFKVVKNKKEHKYCYTVAEKDALLKEEEWQKAEVFRFKGLGEMEAKDLKESTMNPDTRVLLQVTLDENGELDEQVMVACFGDDVSLRKQLILDEEEISLF